KAVDVRHRRRAEPCVVDGEGHLVLGLDPLGAQRLRGLHRLGRRHEVVGHALAAAEQRQRDGRGGQRAGSARHLLGRFRATHGSTSPPDTRAYSRTTPAEPGSLVGAPPGPPPGWVGSRRGWPSMRGPRNSRLMSLGASGFGLTAEAVSVLSANGLTTTGVTRTTSSVSLRWY